MDLDADSIRIIEKVKSSYPPKHGTILALSGGRDSMMLFYIFLEIKKQNPQFQFKAAHLNHSLDYDGFIDRAHQFVQRLCKDYNIPLYEKTVDVKRLAKDQKITVEEAGRYVRYEFFNDLLQKGLADSITTAHHQDDQIETLLMRLFKGTGLKGLKGIMNHETLKRPLLCFSRLEINEFIETHGISYMEDPTNKGLDYLRNRVRNQLIPLIKDLFPTYDRSLLRFQKTMLGSLDALKDILPEWKKIGTFAYTVSLGSLKSLNDTLIGDTFIKGASFLKKEPLLNHKHIESMVVFVREHQNRGVNGNKKILSLKGLTLWGCYDSLYWVLDSEYERYKKEFLSKEEMIITKKEILTYDEIIKINTEGNYRIKPLIDLKTILYFTPQREVLKLMKDNKVPSFLRFLFWGLWENEHLIGLICDVGSLKFIHYKLDVMIFNKD